MTVTSWLSSVDGHPRYYQDGEYIYSQEGKPEFSVSDGWWYSTNNGHPEYFVSDDWIYSRDGKPVFYFG